eukprot:TRINITY_DN80714_c0_g1_i1.p1 TRINITY_DN80714_c0_g1~~TRINITY_DN80714_c0_g1_i1.p1  ORF type:complete len:544 (-),score=79.95 TRINITY_DN80714_c0_g1_i1:307-1764(-)
MPVNTSNILKKPEGNPSLEDKYDLGKVLGKGAFGVVRVAVDKSTGERHACKTISKAKLVVKEDVEDVEREVAIMNLVAGHPNIVTLHDTFEDKHFVHIVMEMCEGGELFDSIVESGKYSEKKAATVFAAMVNMIHHCHELGVMHRDLKPENFLLPSKDKQKPENIKATDFGLSIFFKPGEHMRELVGSPYYVAPEVLKKNYTHAADMWSLGVILYILLSGLPPFWGDSEEQIFKMVLKGHLDFETDPWPQISDAAKDCVRKLLTMDTTKRATAAEIMQHPWLTQAGVAKDEVLDSVVLHRMKQFAAQNKVKKVALMMIGQNLKEDEITGLKQLFQSIDVNGDGTITLNELKNALNDWGHKLQDDQLLEIVNSVDVDGNGKIEYNEFVAMTMHVSRLEKEEVMLQAFRDFDTDNSGYITPDELADALKKFHLEDNVQDLMAGVDKNHDGKIDFQEFVQMLREGNEDLQRAGSEIRRVGLGQLGQGY